MPDFVIVCKKAARSFYLTIRLLPKKLQEPVAIAYLLARASDTVADVQKISDDEEKLLFLLPSLLEQLDKRDLFEQQVICKVWEKILEGQQFELDFFNDEEQKSFNATECDRYLYLVAGSVGEFWTELSDYYFKNFSSQSREQMMRWGVAYGKGLQLINILRDRLEDEKWGRFYYEEAQFIELSEQARCYLQQGKMYVRSIRPRRLRYASSLPVLLAEKTLRLMLKNPNTKKIKVSRCSVYQTLVRALFF